ncbi:MAG: hypothetical protein KHY19_05835 [Coprobacillus cateniformis]|nr:hypothetical protein [Coprobacillus cateniformis]
MQSFGTEEYGNKNEFKIVCCNCGKEARLVPTHYYEDGDYKNPKKIILELRCVCGNKFGATIHHKEMKVAFYNRK